MIYGSYMKDYFLHENIKNRFFRNNIELYIDIINYPTNMRNLYYSHYVYLKT